MKIEMQTRISATGRVIKEEYDIANDADPEEYATSLINHFNATLRPGESPRELLSVTVLKEETTALHPHNWEKQNLVTVIKGGQSYDLMKCSICGVTGKRHGLSGNVVRDSKYKSQKYENCNWCLKN